MTHLVDEEEEMREGGIEVGCGRRTSARESSECDIGCFYCPRRVSAGLWDAVDAPSILRAHSCAKWWL